MNSVLKVLFISPEVVPFAKSGGLADVAGSLPGALKKAGVDARIIMPFYRIVKQGEFEMTPVINNLSAPLGDANLDARIFETKSDDVTVYLVEREDLYDRPNLYGDFWGDYYDNLERFSFFCHAALKTAMELDFHADIIHCHDWQTGLISALLKGVYTGEQTFSNTKTVFTIHNMGYQGIFSESKFEETGLVKTDFFHPEGLEFWGNISLLKAGIVYSDALTTVSPTYANEIQKPEFGMGMEGILTGRSRSLYGILNGIDYNVWNPETDEHIALPYSIKKFSGKAVCKEALIKEMGLAASLKTKPVFGMVSRIDKQKGPDMLLDIMDEIMKLNAGFVLLGSGDENIENAFKNAAEKYKGRIGIGTGFNDPLAHRIIAGSDIFLIPSRYEPCGLTQMYALRYGTVPLVRATGGLNDTVTEYDTNTGKGNGFKFKTTESADLLACIKEATALYKNKKHWKRLIANGMKEDFSWDKSAGRYLELYESLNREKKIEIMIN